MNKYTIYCTEEQTRKALELGAPIRKEPSSLELYQCVRTDEKDNVTGQSIWLISPTAEQMMGFFRSKNIHIVIHKDIVDKWSVYGHEIEPIEFTVFDRLTGYNSFKEATLAAIDAALEYLHLG